MAAKKRQKFPPLYEYSFKTAVERGEAEQYNASHNLNVDCARAITEALSEHYNSSTWCFDAAAASREVVGRFGFDRVMFVLANTVRHYDHDGRISQSNKKWARTVPSPDDRSRYYLVMGHPGITNMLISRVRHDYLLTQPIKVSEVKAEAERILAQFQNLREPNGPDGERFMVRVSPDFLERAKPRHMERLMSLLPFPSLQISDGGCGRDTCAVIDRGEDRFKPLRLRRPSVKEKLAAKPVPGDHPAKPKDREER